MFRRLVSSLPFSPALAGQLGLYATALRREQAIRRIGLLFTICAISVQWFVLANPPEQATVPSDDPLISNGVSSVQQIIDTYDGSSQGSNDFKNLIDYIGITPSELDAVDQATTSVCTSDHSLVIFTRQHHYSQNEGEVSYSIPTSGGVTTFYSAPFYLFDNAAHETSCYQAFTGQSAQLGRFAILTKSGDVILTKQSAALIQKISCNSKNTTCPTPSPLSLRLDATNLSQKARADNKRAKPGDRIQYDFHTTAGQQAASTTIKQHIADLLDYATVIDAGGGNFDPHTKTIDWGDVQIHANTTDTRTFVVQINDVIPATPRASNDPSAYNCEMTISYGNTTNIPVACPEGKLIENFVRRLPPLSVVANTTFSIILLVLSSYLLARSRLLNRELKIIRKDVGL